MKLILELRKINKSYKDDLVLKDLELSLYRGEILSVVGNNGVGKSTLAGIIAGSISIDSGSIFLNKKDVVEWDIEKAVDNGVVLVPQEMNLCENLTVAENIWLGNNHWDTEKMKLPYLMNWKKLYKEVHKILKVYGYTELDVKKQVNTLTSGEKKTLSIIKALTMNTNVIILDEPFTFINDAEKQELINFLKIFKKKGVSILFITHDFADVLNISDRIVVLEDCQIKEDIIKNQSSIEELVTTVLGQDITYKYPKLKTVKKESILTVSNLGLNGMLNNIGFSINKGEILGIVGPSNSGKDIICKILFGMIKPDNGDIFIKNIKQDISSPQKAISLGLSYIPADIDKNALFQEEFIEKNITISRLKKIENEYIRFLINLIYEKEIAKKFIKTLRIRYPRKHKKIKYFSIGNQQKVLISRAIFANSEIILMEEPTKNLDLTSKTAVFNIMNELTRNDKCILFISSNISDVVGMCDRILVMNEDSIAKELKRDEASKESIVSYIENKNTK